MCVRIGACQLPLGASCLVLVGHLVSCYAQDFAPAAAVVEAYLQLLSLVSSLASKECGRANPGRRVLAHEAFFRNNYSPELMPLFKSACCAVLCAMTHDIVRDFGGWGMERGGYCLSTSYKRLF